MVMQKIKNFLIVSTGLIVGLFTMMPAVPAYAAIKDDIQAGACGAAGQPSCDSGTATSSLNRTVTNIINILSVIVGVLAVIMIIFAGFRYITSAANEQAVASAKRTLIYAIVGLILVAFSQIIVRFVLKESTSATTTTTSPTPPPPPPPSACTTPPCPS